MSNRRIGPPTARAVRLAVLAWVRSWRPTACTCGDCLGCEIREMRARFTKGGRHAAS